MHVAHMEVHDEKNLILNIPKQHQKGVANGIPHKNNDGSGFLTVFIDLFSRIIVGWDLSESLERYSMMRALNKSILRRRPNQGLMIHSDRGVQYASDDFRAILKKHHFIQSMSRKGNCWDNAVAESFFHSIKTQMIHHCRFQNVAETELALFNYIEVYYNRRRKHSTNGYKSPANYEAECWNNKKAA